MNESINDKIEELNKMTEELNSKSRIKLEPELEELVGYLVPFAPFDFFEDKFTVLKAVHNYMFDHGKEKIKGPILDIVKALDLPYEHLTI